MNNFTYRNPVKIVFGRDTIAKLSGLVPAKARVLILYGGGSIKKNGVYRQVRRALKGFAVEEFGGIDPNPLYETCMKAVELARRKRTTFLLAVGGGSVLDATKFVAAAIPFGRGDPWTMLSGGAPVRAALPLGAVLTLPATGSEMNRIAVISRASTRDKKGFGSERLYPVFSILDPETTFTLPPRQTGNGIVDAFVHTTEQYLTHPADAPLQDRQAEAILSTLIEEGPKALRRPRDYAARANLMWCATQALNGVIGLGVPGDWASHAIGHELTALYGLDHAQTLAILLPGVLAHGLRRKRAKLAQYGRRVWGIRSRSDDATARAAIAATERFFRRVGVKTRLRDYGVDAVEAARDVRRRLRAQGSVSGEHRDITPAVAATIVRARA